MLRTLLALTVLSLFAPALAAAACGDPPELPLRVEYAESAVAPAIRSELFARPGLVLATGGGVARELREAGAGTLYWQMRLDRLIGLTTAPADPASIEAAADRIYAFARSATACDTPGIALNELQGAWLPTPWSATNAQYRANALAFLRRLRERGGRPYLLVVTSRAPFTGSREAVDWWRQTASLAEIVLQVHFDARPVAAAGAVAGSRRRRIAMRRALERFERIGIPTSRLGLLHGFQSGPGFGGREGLPLPEWLRVVKWEALAARQVIAERAERGTPLGSQWSWGWGDFPDLSPVDPEKPFVACTWLWARDPALCDAPARAAASGVPFAASLAEGQLALPQDVQCLVGSIPAAFDTRAVDRLAAVTRNRGRAIDLLFARTLEWRRASVPWGSVLAAEREIVSRRFGGSRGLYERALGARRAGFGIARALIADQLRRRVLERGPAAEAGWVAWSRALRERALRSTSCRLDEAPGAAAVDPGAVIPFLRLPPPR